MRFTSLLHHVDVGLLRLGFHKLKREASPGVDGVTWHAYAEGLEDRLADLHERLHRGTYRTQPSKRAWAQKPDGRQQPLGIAALEDKIVQRALCLVLEQICEEDFLGFSYVDDFVVGFQHRAEAERFLKELRERLAKFRLELHPEKTRLIE